MTYTKFFDTYETAYDWMVMKNKACERAGNKSDIYCLVPGPEDNFAVVDLATAIELGSGYIWSSNHLSYQPNPWAFAA